MNKITVLGVGAIWLVGVVTSIYFFATYSQTKEAVKSKLKLSNQSVINPLMPTIRIVSYSDSNKLTAPVKKTTSFISNDVELVDFTSEPGIEYKTSKVSHPEVSYFETPEFQLTQKSENTSVDSAKPVLIVYPDELVFEFPKILASSQNIKRAMAKLLLSENPYSVQDWLDQSPISLQKKPYFYKKVLDHNQRPLRYPYAVYAFVDYLMEHAVEESRGKGGSFVLLHVPLVERKVSEPVQKYHRFVANFSRQFNVSEDLVFAIMEVESGFNPKAVSRSNALGLMQLKADTAGRDVFQYIDYKEGVPSQGELFDSENNIRMGAAYLSLLKYDYLSGVRNKENKELLAIASYNGGLSTVLGLFADTKEQAIQKINRLHPRQVYRTLRYQHGSDETRRYLDKVLKAKDRYRQLLDDYV